MKGPVTFRFPVPTKFLAIAIMLLAFILPANADPKPSAETGKSLIGTWYEHGDRNRPCSIARKGNTLIARDHDGSKSELVLKSKDTIYAINWVQNAEIIQDRILWSKGNWWSRRPVVYK